MDENLKLAGKFYAGSLFGMMIFGYGLGSIFHADTNYRAWLYGILIVISFAIVYYSSNKFSKYINLTLDKLQK